MITYPASSIKNLLERSDSITPHSELRTPNFPCRSAATLELVTRNSKRVTRPSIKNPPTNLVTPEGSNLYISVDHLGQECFDAFRAVLILNFLDQVFDFSIGLRITL